MIRDGILNKFSKKMAQYVSFYQGKNNTESKALFSAFFFAQL